MSHLLLIGSLLITSFLQLHAQLLPPPDALKSKSGFPYLLHTQGNGKKPVPGNTIYFHAEIGTEMRFLVNSRNEEGTLSVEIPKSWSASNSPAPIEETAIHMGIGDSATVWVPIEKFIKRPPGFEKASYYVVRLVLLDINTPTLQQKRQNQVRFEEVQAQTRKLVQDYTSGKLTDLLSETPTGLKYLILQPGTGIPAKPRQTVWVHYLGMFLNGKMFDESYRKGEALKFILGRNLVIQGWDEGVALLNPGAQAIFFIPPHLAYGETGAGDRIPPDATLAFFVELTQVK
jgi:FKBP-type peptidyl-prolyl cis-trans isomerase FkpA